MAKVDLIRLEESDLGQLLDGLQAGAEAWNKTADYHRTGNSPRDIIVEESSDADEVVKIAAHYRSIIAKIRDQIEAPMLLRIQKMLNC